MKVTTKNAKAAPRRADRGVPFDEMCRLMRVYGSTKCLRNRRKSGGAANMKIESVRRKFYRWFPDLDERFVKDGSGYYRPKYGHEHEMNYRREMRAKDGESLSKKRTRCRKQRAANGTNTKRATTSSIPSDADCAPVAPVVVPSAMIGCAPVPPTPPVFPSPPAVSPPPSLRELTKVALQELTRVEDMEIGLEPELDHDRTASASIIADTEPCENSFVAERNIFDNVDESFADAEPCDCSFVAARDVFDNVEKSFYGSYDQHDMPYYPGLPLVEHCPDVVSSSCGPSGSCASSWNCDSASVDDMLDRSMEKYCEEILGSDDDGQGQGF